VNTDTQQWQDTREDIKRRLLEVLGPFPDTVTDLQPRTVEQIRCEGYLRRKVLYQAQPGEDIGAYVMVPDGGEGPFPVAFCIHPTTAGSGKDRIAGVWGVAPDTPPDASRSYAHELAQRGYLVFAPDFLTDGERVYPGWKPYHTRPFYEANPEWSAVGKNIWDAMRGIDFLQTVPEADVSRLATIGHSFGGHHSLFIAAFDQRVKCVVSNGGVVSWLTRGENHWARPLDSWYTYINKLRPYYENDDTAMPLRFWEVMALLAPRPLLAMTAQGDTQSPEEARFTYEHVREVYRSLGVPDRTLFYLYPGPHDFPVPIRELAYAWLHRWLASPGEEV